MEQTNCNVSAGLVNIKEASGFQRRTRGQTAVLHSEKKADLLAELLIYKQARFAMV